MNKRQKKELKRLKQQERALARTGLGPHLAASYGGYQAPKRKRRSGIITLSLDHDFDGVL